MDKLLSSKNLKREPARKILLLKLLKMRGTACHVLMSVYYRAYTAFYGRLTLTQSGVGLYWRFYSASCNKICGRDNYSIFTHCEKLHTGLKRVFGAFLCTVSVLELQI